MFMEQSEVKERLLKIEGIIEKLGKVLEELNSQVIDLQNEI